MDYYDTRDFLREDPFPTDESEISRFYDGANVFITGSTGFIGSLILEKLLRCCSGIKQVFLLLRIKKGKTEAERFDELFKNDVYYQLWKTYPEFVNKVKLIPGDCAQPQLGISEKDKESILGVNVIFHSAAELRFDEHLRNSFQTNVCATRDLLELAKLMKNLKGFTYISTAYCHGKEPILKEEFYKPEYNYCDIKTIVDTCSDEEISQIMPLILGQSTTYSLTKSIAEEVIKEYKDHFPIGIVRPSIVMNTHDDPMSGWLNAINGHTAIILGLYLGLLHVIKVSGKSGVDIIPGDKVASAIIASTWDYATNKPLFPIYNVVSTRKSRITWSEFRKFAETAGETRNVASIRSIWKPFSFYVRWQILYKTLFIVLHVIPGVFYDLLLQVMKQNVRTMVLYRKAAHLLSVMDVYLLKMWDFEDDNLYRVWDNMKVNDKKIFNFSMIDFDWKDYINNYVFGIQVYIIKEKLDCDSLVKARRKRDILKVSHYVLISIFVALFLLIISRYIQNKL